VWLGTSSGTIESFNVTTLAMTVSSTAATVSSHTSAVNSIVQINSGQVATGSADTTIKVWNMSSSSIPLVNTYFSQTASMYSLAVLTGGTLASLGGDYKFYTWTLAATPSVTFVEPGGILNTLARNPFDGHWFLARAGYSDAIYETAYPNGWAQPSGHTYAAVDFIPSTGMIVLVGNYIDLILVPSGTVNYTVSNGGTSASCVKSLPDNITVVVGQTNGLVKLFSTSSKSFGVSQSVHTAQVVMIQVTPDLNYLISAAADNKVIVWVWSTLTQVNAFTPSLTGTLSAGAVLASTYTGKRFFFSTEVTA
jgi:WD40 repeat protein